MEETCPLCGFDTELVAAITEQEIVRICELCAEKNNFPVIRKPTNKQINRAARFQGVNQGLVKQISSIKPVIESKVDRELNSIIASNVKSGEYKDLVDNFHWHIQQARRYKKISQKQVANAIAEPEILIKMAEKAKLPQNYDRLISKLEQFLAVRLRNRDAESNIEAFDINKANLFAVTTTDLKKMQEQKKEQKGKEENMKTNKDEEDEIEEDDWNDDEDEVDL